MTQATNDAVWQGIESRLRRVEPLVPPAPPWTGPSERPSDGVIRVVAGSTISRRQGAGRRSSWPLTAVAAGIAVIAVAIGLSVLPGPADRIGAVGSPLPAALDWRWTSPGPPDGLTLDVSASVVTLHVSGVTVEFGAGLSSAVRMTVVQERPGLGCQPGSVGVYDWRFDGTRLVLSAVDDDCLERSAAMQRTWIRQFPRTALGVRSIPGGDYRLDWLRPAITLTKPIGLQFTAVMEGRSVPPDVDSYWSGTEANGGVLVIARVESVPADACDDSAGVVPLDQPTPGYVVAALGSVSGLEVGEPTVTQVDGRAALRVDLTAAASCAQGYASIWTAAPTARYSQGGESQLRPGDSARVTIVDVDGVVVAVAVHPRLDLPDPVPLDEAEARLRALIDSIAFD